jgi:hypothetical protein
MKSSILVLGVLLNYTLQGCSPGGDEPAPTPGAGEPQHVWKDQVKALDKAKGLEQDMNKAFEQRNQEIDQQTE